MDSPLVTGVCCAIAGVLAGRVLSILLAKRTNGNGNGYRKLAASREMADLMAAVEDLLTRVSDVETSVERVNRLRGRNGD